MIARFNRLVPSYCFVLIRGLPPVSNQIFQQYYGNNSQQLTRHFNQLTALGLNRTGVAKLLKERPDLFKSPAGDLKIKKVVEQFKSKYGNGVVNVIQINPRLLQQKEYNRMKGVLQNSSFSNGQIEMISQRQPHVFTDRLEYRLDEMKKLLKSYLGLNQQQANSLIAKQPFILKMRMQRIRDGIKYLIFKGIPQAEVRDMVENNIQIFQMGVDRLTKLFKIPEGWGVEEKTVRDLVMHYREYLSLCPFQMIGPKINILNDYKIPKRIAKHMFEQYPIILILSISSLQAKLNLFKERLKVPLEINELFPYLLTKNYNAILRPRVQIMLRMGLSVNRGQFDISDEEFCKANSIPLQQLMTEKNKYKITNQRDYKTRFYSKILKEITQK